MVVIFSFFYQKKMETKKLAIALIKYAYAWVFQSFKCLTAV